jgi:hypothetical protein
MALETRRLIQLIVRSADKTSGLMDILFSEKRAAHGSIGWKVKGIWQRLNYEVFLRLFDVINLTCLKSIIIIAKNIKKS